MFELVRKITVKTQAFHKYGCPLFLFLVFTFLNDTDWYNKNYWWITVLFDCSLFMGVMQLYACYIYRKCEWQETSCWGLVLFGLINLYAGYLNVNLNDSMAARLYLDLLHFITIVILFTFTLKTLILILKEDYGC